MISEGGCQVADSSRLSRLWFSHDPVTSHIRDISTKLFDDLEHTWGINDSARSPKVHWLVHLLSVGEPLPQIVLKVMLEILGKSRYCAILVESRRISLGKTPSLWRIVYGWQAFLARQIRAQILRLRWQEK
ncbi:MAG: hypothetical protein CL912_19370 [Deltaproteobacteria bacterium]|nr:hypothetical protein [Deltaproteobacteria bacterium]